MARAQALQKRSRIRTDEEFCGPSLGQSARLDWHPKLARRGPRAPARSTQTRKHTAQEDALMKQLGHELGPKTSLAKATMAEWKVEWHFLHRGPGIRPGRCTPSEVRFRGCRRC